MQQQHQMVGQGEEQDGHIGDGDSDGYGDSDGDGNTENYQDIDDSEASRPAKRRKPSPSHSDPTLGDAEPTFNARAEYQEWPMHGFFKRTTIGNEIRYGMGFSLEQLQELCALACPHSSQAGSDRDFSTRSTSSSRQTTQAEKTRLGLASQRKRIRFTQRRMQD
jgi:hypothetical protein